MQSQAHHTEPGENNLPAPENTTDNINSQSSRKSEPITQIQKDSVLTSQDLPDKRLLYGFTLVILSAFLLVTAIYYKVINP